ncbi:MAG TPA: sulfatase [Spirochaetota bacterium]|nr:sulfatase [Spirochaetota bacterium]
MNKPNILLITIDDLGWKDLSCYGSDFYETPVIDQLAADGLKFSNAYASCPVCSPTRASIMSGKYPARVGVTQWIGGHAVGKLKDVPYFNTLPMNEIALPAALKKASYQTWHVGKWHLGEYPANPLTHGFDVNIGGCGWGCPHEGYFSPYNMPELANGPKGEYLTDRITAEAVNLIKNRDQKQPFFLNLSHYAVHTPIEAPTDLIKKYEQKAARMGLDKMKTFEEGEHFACLHKKDERIKRRLIQSDTAYAAMLENLDMNIGKVLETLSREGLEKNTIILFTSDNGGLSTAEGSPTCNLPLSEGKGWMYEGGTRVCQLIKWPGKIKAGTTTAVPVTSTDFYPTFLELAGLPLMPDQHADGTSLLPLFKENGRLAREDIYWHYPHYSNQGGAPAASIRSGTWKLIKFFEDNHLELYNLAEDIEEKVNLAEKKKEITAELHQKLTSWQREVEALIPGPNKNYQFQTALDSRTDPPEV